MDFVPHSTLLGHLVWIVLFVVVLACGKAQEAFLMPGIILKNVVLAEDTLYRAGKDLLKTGNISVYLVSGAMRTLLTISWV